MGELSFDDLLVTKNACHSLARFSPFRKPILRPLQVYGNLCGIGNRIVLTDHLESPAIPRPALLDDDNPVIWTFLGPDAGQANCYQTVSLLDSKKPDQYIRESRSFGSSE